MKYLKAILLALLVGSCLCVQAGKKNKIVQQKVYIYGFSVSFVDSVAYLTDVMELDSASILSNGFLAERQLYSMQLGNYIQERFNLANTTNAVFFSKKRKDLDSKHEKMNRRYQRSVNLSLIYLSQDDFRFHPEEHIEAVEIDEEAETSAEGKEAVAADSKKKRTKKKNSKESNQTQSQK